MGKDIEVKKNEVKYLGARIPIDFYNKMIEYLNRYNEKNLPRMNITIFVQRAFLEFIENNPV